MWQNTLFWKSFFLAKWQNFAPKKSLIPITRRIKTRYIYINSFRLGKIVFPFDYLTNYVRLNMSLVFTLAGYIALGELAPTLVEPWLKPKTQKIIWVASKHYWYPIPRQNQGFQVQISSFPPLIISPKRLCIIRWKVTM